MRKKILRNIIMIEIIFAIALILAPDSNAALTITSSKATVEAGETFNVTIAVSSNEAGEITLSASNGTLSQTHIDLMTEHSATVSCVAGTSGTIGLKATGLVANYTTETEGTQKASTSVTIQAKPTPTPTPTPTSTPDTSVETPTPTTEPTSEPTPEPTPVVTATPEPVQGKYYLYITPSEYDTFKFDKNTKKYSVEVPNEITSIGIYLGGAEVKTVSGTGTKNLEVGNTSCKISVTEIDGTEREFELVVTRSAEPTETVPNVVEEPEELLKLSSLEVKNAKISPAFNSDVYEYEVELGNDIEKLDILATANIENASIDVTGNENFMEGENTVAIVLKSEDGTKAATYTITVTKGSSVKETEVEELKEDEELQPTEEEKKTSFSFLKSGNTGMIVILVIAVVALLAAICTVVIILIKNKKDNEAEMMSFTPNLEYNVFEEKVEEKKEEIETETEERPDREKRRGKHF